MPAKLIKITCPLRDGDVCYGCAGKGSKMVREGTEAKRAAKSASKEAYHAAVSAYHDELIQAYRSDSRIPAAATDGDILGWVTMLAKKDGKYKKPVAGMSAKECHSALLVKRPGEAAIVDGWAV